MMCPSSRQTGRVGQNSERGQRVPLAQSRHDTGANELPSATRMIWPRV